jgi:hypothetical protein
LRIFKERDILIPEPTMKSIILALMLDLATVATPVVISPAACSGGDC